MEIRITQHTLQNGKSLEDMEEEAYSVVRSLTTTKWINFHPISANTAGGVHEHPRTHDSPNDPNSSRFDPEDVEGFSEFSGTDFHAVLGISHQLEHLDLEAALALIPLPHVIWYTDENARPRERLASVKPALVREQIHPDALRLLQDHCSRCAWVIPIIGVPPYPYHLSAGEVVLPPPGSSGVFPVEVERPPEQVIRWTPESLLAFWEWLKLSQKKNVFGPISLIYDRHKSKLKPNQNDFYFIKVVHKATLSMKLRIFLRVFDANLESPSGQKPQETSTKGTAEAHGERSKKNRHGMILAQARLILIDEANEGVVTA